MGIIKIDFWYEFASPYSYLTAMRITDMAKAKDVEVKWRPFLLGAVYKMMKLPTPLKQLSKEKFGYVLLDVARQAKRRGVPINPSPKIPKVAVLPSRVALIGLTEGWGEEFSRQVFQAYFSQGKNISNPHVLGKILERMGQDAGAIFEKAATREIKDRLRAETQEAFDAKIFGAPTFMVGDEMFWGDDRLEMALEAVLAADKN